MELNSKAIEAIITTGLPIQARWMINGTPLDFDFSIAGHGLRKLSNEVTEPGDVESFDLLVFGEQDFAQGGGARPWLCIRKADGSVFGFDLERENPSFLLNSSIEQFIMTFQFLNKHLEKNVQLPPDCESHLHAIDPEAYPRSDWRLLVKYLRGA